MSVIAVVFVAVLGVFEHWFADRLLSHRIDLSPVQSHLDGRSGYPVINMLDPRNYDSTGRRKLRVMYFAVGLQVLAGLIFVFTA